MPSKRPIAVGQRFGRWTVIDPERHLGTEGWRARVRAAECRRDCGAAGLVRLSTLTERTSRSCGCLASEQKRAWGRVRENIMPMLRAAAARAPSETLIAQNVARLRSAEHRALVSATHRTHGLSEHPLYGTWRIMRRRCENPRVKDYPRYGGQGITVCAEWRDVTAFITWIEANIGPRPVGRTLDRIDNDGHYEPGNVRWATAKEQSANRRRAPAILSERLAG